MNRKHFMDCWDYSTEELLDMVKLIRMLKEAAKKRCVPKILQDQSLGMIFNGNSTRTRISFEVAINDLGGHGLYLTGGDHGELHLGKREAIKDSAIVISSMVDGIAMRWSNTAEIEEFASYSTVPLYNGMDYTRHPTQTLADLTTIIENMPEGKTLADIKVTFIGSDDIEESSCNDLARLIPRFGGQFTVGCPEGHAFDERFNLENNGPEIREKTAARRKQACEEGGGSIFSTHDPIEAVKDADFVYTGCFTYEGMENEDDVMYFQRVFLDKGFQVSEELLSHCPNAKTMHYLPALRGKEMTDYAMDFEGSLLWKEAENRLHTQRGLLAYLMGMEVIDDFDTSGFNELQLAIVNQIKGMKAKYGTEYTHK